MPTYEYECTQCTQRLEIAQRFSDAPLTICSNCGGELRKVFSAVGVVFKGSGFYKNDSREAAKSVKTAVKEPSKDASNDATVPSATTATTAPVAPAPTSVPSPSTSSAE